MPSHLKRALAAITAAVLIIATPVGAKSWSSLIPQVRTKVALVKVYALDGELDGSCTGFSINTKLHYFLTADHCLGASMTVDGKDAKVVYQDWPADLLVLQVPEASGAYQEFEFAKDVRVGEAVAAYGWGYGLNQPTFKAGTVAATALDLSQFVDAGEYGGVDERYLMVDFDFIHGMSGGPVFDDSGKLVSIVQIGTPDEAGCGRSLQELKKKVGSYFDKQPN